MRGGRIKEADLESACAHGAALLLDGFGGVGGGHSFDLTAANNRRNNVP